VKSIYSVKNIKCDTAGRALVFDIGGLTFGNLYGHSGTDARSRANRENFYAEVVPQLLTSRKHDGYLCGDFNCIIEKADATNHPEAKMSNCLKRVNKVFDMKDSYRALYPKVQAFSRYYEDTRGQGATCIDRQYHFGNNTVREAKYLPLSFSDHHSFIVTICLPDPLSKIIEFTPN
jgi:exonuclease III